MFHELAWWALEKWFGFVLYIQHGNRAFKELAIDLMDERITYRIAKLEAWDDALLEDS